MSTPRPRGYWRGKSENEAFNRTVDWGVFAVGISSSTLSVGFNFIWSNYSALRLVGLEMTPPKDETKMNGNKFMGVPDCLDGNFKNQMAKMKAEDAMTNLEWAEEISFETGAGDFDTEERETLRVAIARALDEKDVRLEQAIQEITKGYVRGQKEMRERAAKALDKHSRRMPNVWADEIRALPIEGE